MEQQRKNSYKRGKVGLRFAQAESEGSLILWQVSWKPLDWTKGGKARIKGICAYLQGDCWIHEVNQVFQESVLSEQKTQTQQNLRDPQP